MRHLRPTTLRLALAALALLASSGRSPGDEPKKGPANRLARETSPYLLLHAHNPVDWYPWGPEAFAKAKAENKPIFLSVGYSSCYWCHVMERESFMRPERSPKGRSTRSSWRSRSTARSGPTSTRST